mgnify:FL=1
MQRHYQTLLLIAIIDCQIRKKALTVWKFQTIRVILYSKLHFMFSHDFCHFTG